MPKQGTFSHFCSIKLTLWEIPTDRDFMQVICFSPSLFMLRLIPMNECNTAAFACFCEANTLPITTYFTMHSMKIKLNAMNLEIVASITITQFHNLTNTVNRWMLAQIITEIVSIIMKLSDYYAAKNSKFITYSLIFIGYIVFIQ